MTSQLHILAEGLPAGVIFGVIVFFLWGLTAVFGKKTPTLSKPTGMMTDLAEVRRRILMEQAAEKRAAQERVVAMRERANSPKPRQQKAKKQKAAPPPMPTQRLAQSPAPPRLPSPQCAATPPVVPLSAHRPRVSETARNVRMLLQRSGMAEAFVLGEILGKPKGLD